MKSLLLLTLLISGFECLAQDNVLPNLSKDIVSVAEIFKTLPGKNGERYSAAMKHGEAEVFLYAPVKTDGQTPHDKAELYVIISGSGIFFNGKDKVPFIAGDVIFVPAHAEHRFEKFSNDFKTWVIFYGEVVK